MIICLVLFLFIPLSSLMGLKYNKLSSQLFIFNILIIYFFTVFRYGVGEEYFQYEELFKQVLPIKIRYQFLILRIMFMILSMVICFLNQ